MSSQQRQISTDVLHPALAAVYFVAIFVFTMVSFQPVLIALALAGALLSNCAENGMRKALRALRWQIPFLLIVAILNPIISPVGTTEVLRWGTFALYKESIVYGICMGCMLVAIMQWFSCAACVLTTDKMMMLTGRFIPTIGLMISMIGRLVPHFVKRGQTIGNAAVMNSAALQYAGAGAASAGAEAGAAGPVGTGGAGVNDDLPIPRAMKKRRFGKAFSDGVHQSSVLMAWSLEDSLETADAMHARGWGAGVRRTTYTRYSFKASDALLLILLLALIALCGLLAYAACSQFVFYPTMPKLIVWWGYVPYALMMLLPVLYRAFEAARWRLCR